MKGSSFLIALACLQFVHSRSITDPQVLPLAPETNGRCATVRCANGTTCRLIAPLNCTNNCELQPTCVPNNDSCPPNQELQSCGSACEETCDQPVQVCTMQCVLNVCRCKAGYVKDSNGNCILKSDCGKNTSPLTCATMKCREGFMCTQVMINCVVAPCHQPPPQCVPANPGNGSNSTGAQTCSVNEVWNACGNVCEGQCGQPLKFCPAICKTEGACTCKSGYVRENGVCVLESQCPPSSNSTGNKICAANEIWNQCGALCERKCGDIRRACPAVCLPQGACTCKEGFARQNGACVSEAQCPSATPIPGSSCALVDCMTGTTCIEETVQCFAPPCAPIARCVPTGNATCDTVKLKCQENYSCGIVNGIPQCVFNGPSSCAATLCAFGSQCIEEPIPCLVAPCPVQAKCVANSNNDTTGTTCAATSCEIGYDCIEETNPCLVAPCPTTARCVQNSNTGITCANIRMKCHEGEQCGMVNGSPTCVKACGANETYQSCSSMCEPRCGVVNKMACIASCGPPMCQCNPGYTRNASNVCVLPNDCGPLANNDSEITCANVDCKSGSVCSMVNGVPKCLANKCPKGNMTLYGCGACDLTCYNFHQMCADSCRPASCGCMEGYVRNGSDFCVATIDCPVSIYPTDPVVESCGTNEILSNCTSCEPSCDNLNPICTLECGTTACICAPGYVRDRNNGKCVTNDQCDNNGDSDPLCGPNEKFVDCMPTCESNCRGDSCNTNGTNISITQCVPGCTCKKYYKRDNNGKCQHTEQCHKHAHCGLNEIWSNCRPCEQTCANPGQTKCTEKCHQGCACDSGFSRNSDGDCVDEDLGCV